MPRIPQMNPQFKVQSVTTDRGRAYVRTIALNSQYFSVAAGSTLGGVRLSEYLREPQSDIIVFRLEDPADASRFAEGDIVELDRP
jgi:hypothetical protein